MVFEPAGGDNPRELVAPKRIEVSGIVNGELRAHLQPIRFDGMKGANAPVEAREDPQVALQPCELRGIHHLGRHALVLNAVIEHDGRGEVTGECGIVEIAVSQDGPELMQGVEARPQQFVTHVP